MRAPAFLLGLVVAVAASAQQHAFRQLTTKDGLAQSQVRAIAQDGSGYIWFGTLGGASQYDGHGFRNLTAQDGLPDPQVSAMARDAQGALWMGVGNAVLRVEGRRTASWPIPGTDKGSRVLGLASHPDGRLFIGTDGSGVHVLSGGAFAPLPGFPSDSAKHVRTLLLLGDGTLLIGLRNGLLHWAEGRCRPIQVGDAEPKLISALAEGTDGSWWVGTLGSGLYHVGLRGELLAEFDEETGLLQNNVRCLLRDDRSRLWVGTKLGLNLIEDARLRTFTVHQGLPNDNIQCAFQDREGNLWFGTDGGGAIMHLGDRFVTYTLKDGLCSDLVMSITADARGDLWLGTYDNGICRMDGMAMITTLDGLPNNTVWCGLADADGSLWFGTSDGIAHVVDGLVQRWSNGSPLSGSRVFALHQDAAGAIWCGTRDGLYRMARDGATARIEGGPSRAIRAIHAGADGSIELAGDEGYFLYREGRFEHVGLAEGLSDETALSLARDAKGVTWVGTANGITCLLPGGPRTFRMGPEFGSNYINFLLPDQVGALWAGSNNGLFRFVPDSLLANPSAFKHFTLSDGLRGLEFNLNAAHTWSRGRMLFGSATGMVMHDSARARAAEGPIVPMVSITAVRSFLQPTDWAGSRDSLNAAGLPVGLHLSHRRHYLTFDYAALSFRHPEETRYRYRLIGIDTDWLPPTTDRFASYGNLPHGEYTFEVSASVANGPWCAPSSISFRIDPPFWARWWFYLACVIAASGAAFIVHRYRAMRRARREHTRQLVLRSRMLQLEQQALNANMNRHFVFNALNSIQFHINKQDRATASRYLTSFAKLIRKNLDASQNDTTTLAEELERLDLYLKLEHMRFKDKFRYSITVDPTVDANHVRLPAMMLQPYVENSIWHGILPMENQGHVSISAVTGPGNGRVTVRIEDDGIGLEESRRAKRTVDNDHISRGIEITKGRADVLRRLNLSDIRIDGPKERLTPSGERSQGTVVIIELPVQLPPANRVGGLQTASAGATFES